MIFFSGTTWPRAVIFGMLHHHMDHYTFCSNYGPVPGVSCFIYDDYDCKSVLFLFVLGASQYPKASITISHDCPVSAHKHSSVDYFTSSPDSLGKIEIMPYI